MSPISAELSSPLKPLYGADGQKTIDFDMMTTLSRAVSDAAAQDQLEDLQHFVRSFPGSDTIHAARAYTEALIATARRDAIGTDLNFQPLCEKLNQAEVWPVLARVALQWLEATLPHPALRYLVRAWKHGGTAAVPIEVLRAAQSAFPDDAEICYALGQTLEESGSSREGRRMLATAVQQLATEGDVARVEEIMVRLVEAPEASVHRQLLEAVEALCANGKAGPAAALFDTLLPVAVQHGLADLCWQAARRVLLRHPKETAWRAPAVAAVRKARAEVESIDRAIEASGLARPAVAAAEALELLDRVLNFAPGYYVEHSGWGLGPIKDNDGEFLTVDFPNRPRHRMNLKAAAGVLKTLPADDLKVQITVRPQALKELAQSDPVALVVLALRRAGGEGAAADLRKHLVPAVLGTGEWSAWWKRAKPLLVNDTRVDARQAFRDNYRILKPGDAEETVELPPLDEQLGIDRNIENIYSFADHHPGTEDRMAEAYRERVQRWADRRSAPKEERARALRLLLLWEPERRAVHEAAIRGLFTDGLDLSAAGGVQEMFDLLAIGIGAPETRDLALREGLNARNAAVREKAIEHLFELAGDEPVTLVTGWMSEPSDNIDLLFLFVDKIGERPAAGDPRLDDLLWPTVNGLLDLLNATGREPVRKKGLKMLEPSSAFMKQVELAEFDDRREAQLMTRLRDWKASDRVLFPILEGLEQIGLMTVVKSVREKRKAAAARIFATAPAIDDVLAGPIIMTRHTFERLAHELERISLELKTTIPQIIRRARELGDLRENAEYEAAKLKQRQYSQRLTELDAQISNVRILEDMAFDPELVLPGTEVVVSDEADGSVSTYWVLGEGDGDYGAGVISYRAPLGKALTNHRAGDVVDYAAGDGSAKRLRIVSFRPRKPGGPPAEAPSD